MKFDSSCFKEHKNYVAWIIVIILIIVAVAWISEFREGKEWKNNKEWWNRYESRFGWEKWRYEKDNNEKDEWSKYSKDENENVSDNNESNNKTNNEAKNNKVNLPLNMISEADASKVALTSNSWAKVITSASIENEDWTVAYSFVLDNKTEVNVDAVNWKVITDDKKWNDTSEKDETNSGSGKTAQK